MLAELIKQNRSCRRFFQNHPVDLDILKSLVDLARLSASAANMQPLKYMISNTEERNSDIFSCLGWAAYLTGWDGPEEGERPSAYIIILGDTDITRNFWCDHGIAAQSILLGAREQGLGGCMIASIKKERLMKLLHIPDRYDILLILAIGKPKETIVIEIVGKDNSIRYWRDEKNIHHVPKRKLDDIIIDCF